LEAKPATGLEIFSVKNAGAAARLFIAADHWGAMERVAFTRPRRTFQSDPRPEFSARGHEEPTGSNAL